MSTKILTFLLLLLYACNDSEKTEGQGFFRKPLVTDSNNVVYNAEFVKPPFEVNKTLLRFSEGVKVNKKSAVEVFNEEMAFKFLSPEFKAAIFLINSLPLEVPCYSNLKALVNATNVSFLVNPSKRKMLPSAYLSLPTGAYTLQFANTDLNIQLSDSTNCGVIVFGSQRFFIDTFNF